MQPAGEVWRVLTLLVVSYVSVACEDGSPLVILGEVPRGPSAGSTGESAVSDEFVEHARREYELFERWRKEMECMEVAPVCGVDGLTYPNACQAGNAGTRVAKDGECS
jgi:hypothetical protein